MSTTTAVLDTGPDPIELIREVFEKLNQRNADALYPYFAEDIVDQFPTGTLRGRDEVRSYFTSLFAEVPDFHIHALNIACARDTILVRWHSSGTFAGAPWMGIEPTGSRLELDGTDCFTVRNCKIAENFIVFDQLSFARQIGMMPSEGSLMDRMLLKSFNLRTRLRRRVLRTGA